MIIQICQRNRMVDCKIVYISKLNDIQCYNSNEIRLL